LRRYTVDNALFLWRFDVPNDVPVEYSGGGRFTFNNLGIHFHFYGFYYE
jgi:hypothetical protein